MFDLDWQGHLNYIRDLAGNPSYKDAFTYLGAFVGYVVLFNLGAIGGKAAWSSVRGPLSLAWIASKFAGGWTFRLGKLAAHPVQTGYRSWQLRRRITRRMAEEKQNEQMRVAIREMLARELDAATAPSKSNRRLDGGLERGRDYLGTIATT